MGMVTRKASLNPIHFNSAADTLYKTIGAAHRIGQINLLFIKKKPIYCLSGFRAGNDKKLIKLLVCLVAEDNNNDINNSNSNNNNNHKQSI